MKRPHLSTVVSESLRERIRSGSLAAGVQLPTEAELCEEYSVSRTVIREAVARLRSEGLVIPRQGKGVFVSEAPAPLFTIPDESLRSLPQTLALLELRLAVESEAAALCARRRSEADLAAIRAEMARADEAHPDPSSVQVHYDYDLHLAIARGAGNDYILDFLIWMRPLLVPRIPLGYLVDPGLKDSYFDRIHGEHLAVVNAIARQDAEGARCAMHGHLEASLARLRALSLARGQSEVGSGSPAVLFRPLAD